MNKMTLKVFRPLITLGLCGLLAFQFQSKPPSSPKNESIKVLSYNIHHANPPESPGKIDIQAISDVIKGSGADVVALQEVDLHTERSGKELNQMQKLAELTGMEWHFHKSIDHQGGEYGNGILSALPILEKGGFSLPYQKDTEPRGVAYVRIALESGKSLLFASTHLDFTNEANTLMQAKHLNEYFLEVTEPLIVAGDFNSEPGSGPIRYLETYFESSCQKNCPPTIPQVNPIKTIDFIFLRKDKNLIARNHSVIEEPYASDHLPVLATVEIGD
jgi:endonuclease/exonuclease/phosphatase family metal-dependent hydrolase